MNLPKKPNILYFVDGMTATNEDRLKAAEYSLGNVQFRNAHRVTGVEAEIDGVAGSVIPPAYEGYPSAEKVLTKYAKALSTLRESTGDEQAPKLPVEDKAPEPVEAPEPKPIPMPKKKA